MSWNAILFVGSLVAAAVLLAVLLYRERLLKRDREEQDESEDI